MIDRNPKPSQNRPYIIWWAIAVHIAWGITLIVNPNVLPVAVLVGLHWVVNLGVSGPVLGIILICCAVLAVASLVLDKRLSNLLSLYLLLPQYALLVAAFISDTQSVFAGSVDGRQIDQTVLFIVLWPIMIAAILHSLAIIERHARWTSRQ